VPVDQPDEPAGPMGPPLDEPGFPALPMFAGDYNEIINAVAPQRLAMLSSSLMEGVGLNGVAVFGGQPQGQLGVSYQTRLGVLKAEMLSLGVLQTTLEGFQPLPFTQFTAQVAFCPGGAMGVGQAVIMTPVGILMGSGNLGGQLSGELLTGFSPGEGSQVLIGGHVWGLPGTYGGCKAAIEWQQAILKQDGEPISSGTITLAVTRPYTGQTSASLSVSQRTSDNTVLVASVEGRSQADPVIAFGGSRQLGSNRLRGRYSTNGLLGLALDVCSDRSVLSLIAQVDSTPGKSLSPSFGATVQLMP